MTLCVRVKPRASKSAVLGVRSGELEVAVRAPPVDGKANEELVRVLADYYEIPKSTISIARGQSGRSKTVRLAVVPPKLR